MNRAVRQGNDSFMPHFLFFFPFFIFCGGGSGGSFEGKKSPLLAVLDWLLIAWAQSIMTMASSFIEMPPKSEMLAYCLLLLAVLISRLSVRRQIRNADRVE